MSLWPKELEKIAKRALKASKAPETEVWVHGSAESHLRFAANTVSTSGTVERTRVTVVAAWGQQAGTASTEDVTPDGIARVVRRAADLAKLVPASPERMPPVKRQKYPRTQAWDAATAEGFAESRAGKAAAALAVAKETGLVAAGFLSEEENLTVFLNSEGASGLDRRTSADFSTTFRTPDGKQSGWAGASSIRAADIDAAALARRAAEKAQRWKQPIELPPGRYTAVLEPAAVAPLLGFVAGSLDRRAADEGRSPFSRKDGGTRIGERIFAPGLTLASDPADRVVPGSPFAEDGLAAGRVVAVEDGRLVTLPTSRFWAAKKGLPVTPSARNWSLTAAKPVDGLDALIAGTERGILVTRIWYVRMLAPQTLTVTGLTRDATFLIEKGKVTSPIRNFRINQSVLDLLANAEAAGPTGLVGGMGVPALRVRDLGFASVSEAV